LLCQLGPRVVPGGHDVVYLLFVEDQQVQLLEVVVVLVLVHDAQVGWRRVFWLQQIEDPHWAVQRVLDRVRDVRQNREVGVLLHVVLLPHLFFHFSHQVEDVNCFFPVLLELITVILCRYISRAKVEICHSLRTNFSCEDGKSIQVIILLEFLN
jgi:hypothetical protein